MNLRFFGCKKTLDPVLLKVRSLTRAQGLQSAAQLSQSFAVL